MVTALLALLLCSVSSAGSLAGAVVLPEGGPGVRFDTASTTLWTGRSAVLTFHCDPGGSEGAQFDGSSSDPSVFEILSPPAALPGASSGTLRLLGVAAGSATLRVGDAEIEIDVRPLVAQARAWLLEPSIVTPVRGAVCSGTVSVGVEVTCAAACDDVVVVLELPGGQRLHPVEPFVQDGGPNLRRCFDVDTEALVAGEQTLRAIVLSAGEEVGQAELTMDVAHSSGTVLSGECEDGLDAERPEAFGAGSPRAGGGAGASAGAFVVLPRNNVTWVTPIEIAETGRFQLFVRARGDLAGGAFPSIAAAFDAPRPYSGTTRLVDHRWQRVPVGGPVELFAGEHHLALRLLNDLNVGHRSDRKLFVDTWELVRIEDDGEGGGASMMMMDGAAGQRGPRGPGLWIGLEIPFDGLRMSGRLWIRGAVNWSGEARSAAPRVELVVNGEVRATQQTSRPSFALDRVHLGAGRHAIYLRASLPDGRSARTPAQRLTVEGPVAAVVPRDIERFAVLDERWDAGLSPHLNGQGEEARQRVARPTREVEATLTLPEEMTGQWEVLLEARAAGKANAAAAAISLVVDGERSDELTTEVHDWWALRSFGLVTLPEGEKSIVLRLEPQGEEPQLRVRGLLFKRTRDAGDRRPPHVRLVYPQSGHAAHGVDVAVVEAFDDDALKSVDAIIDGRPQGTFGHVPPGAGPLTVPLLLRDVAAGEHTLSVRVLDSAGNMAETEPIMFTVLDEAPPERGQYARAIHLLNRLAFGPDAMELAEILTKGEDAWLADALSDESAGHDTARGFADVRAGDRIAYDADRLVLTYALRTDNPVLTRFTLWVDNHFSTWGGKTGTPSEWAEHREFARMGWAPFGEFLRASATSGVMLVYLDQDRSYAGRINENYGRELLELHTVGVDGGYDQGDVTELAHLLAGLTVSQEAPVDGSGAYQRRVFRFDPELSDGRPCALFDREFPRSAPADRFDRFTEALELLARRPETARFVARKIAEHYAQVPAPDALVDDLADVFQVSGGDPRAIITALVAHHAFWESADVARLASPLDYGLRVGRACRQTAVDWSLRQFLQNSGMGLFDRVTPDGYPDDDAAWADTNGLLQRWRWVQQIPWATRALVPPDARRDTSGDPHAWMQRIIDHAAVSLTGWTLAADSNTAALLFFEADEAQTWQRVNNIAELVCRLPESNLK